MIAQWDSSPSVLLVARVQLPNMEYLKGFFPDQSHALHCTQFREYQRAEWRPLIRIVWISLHGLR